MKIPKNYKLTKNTWHDFGSVSVYVDGNGMISKAMKADRTLPAAVYESANGGFDNIMPCTREHFRKSGVIF